MIEEAKERLEALQLSKAELQSIVRSSASSNEWTWAEIAAAEILLNEPVDF